MASDCGDICHTLDSILPVCRDGAGRKAAQDGERRSSISNDYLGQDFAARIFSDVRHFFEWCSNR
jgi:hypothetical protein